NHFDRATRPQLAGEAHIGWRADPAQHALLVLSWWIDAAYLAAHPHAAGRAAPAPAAYMGMRDAGEPTGFKHAGPGHHLEKPAVRIADAQETAAALPRPTDEACEQHCCHRAGEEPGEDVGDLLESERGPRRRQGHVDEGLAGPPGVCGQYRDLP